MPASKASLVAAALGHIEEGQTWKVLPREADEPAYDTEERAHILSVSETLVWFKSTNTLRHQFRVDTVCWGRDRFLHTFQLEHDVDPR